MKRTCLLLAALLLAFVPAAARTVKKTYDIEDFTGISASGVFQVTLEKSKTFSVEIEVTEDFLPYLVVKNRGGMLELGFASLPFRLRKKDRSKVAQAVIKMPVLTAINLSGASTLTANDQFSNAMNKLSVNLRGSSTVRSLNVKAPDVDIEISGTSSAVINLRSSEVDVELSGASKLELTGSTVDIEAEVRGASRFEAAKCETQDLDLTLSGASNADVFPTRNFKVALTGASKCRYYGDAEKLKVNVVKVTGASTLRHQEQ